MHKLAVVFAYVSIVAGCGDKSVTPDAAPPATFTARIRGPLAAATVGDSKTYHDGVAKGGEPQANANGDFAHLVGLGISDLGTPLNEFLALDRWSSVDGANGLYGDPMFQAAFRPLFSA